LAVAVDIYQSKYPEIRGVLSNITERGIAITGMPARIGEITPLMMPTGDFIDADAIMFEAECRWAKEEEETGEWLAGFEIIKISEKCLDDLRTLIQSLPFLD
jgi:hypothetical protein